MENDDVRSGSLSRGLDTFTLDRLDAILKEERFPDDYRNNADARPYSDVSYAPPKIRAEIDTTYFDAEELDEGIRCFSDREARIRATRFCKELYGHSTAVPISATRLDAMFSKAFRFRFEPLEDSQAIIERAAGLLERMPKWPLEFIDIWTKVPTEYHISSVASTASRDARLWEQL